jgi:hypothetical protein
MFRYVQFTMIGAALALASCGDSKGQSSATTATTQNPSTDGSSGTDSDGSTSSASSSTTTSGGTSTSGTTAVDPTTGGTTTTAGSCEGFICPPDGGGGGVKECDVWTQDCPAGEKCVPWADDGGGSWNATKCEMIPQNPGQEGDPCTYEGSGVSGVDSCDKGLLCWYFDGMGGGSCIDMCDGSPDAQMCDMGQLCDVSNDGVLILCLNTCDPLITDCPPGQICFAAQSGTDFICDFDASGETGAYGDPCEYINVCDPGHFCADATAVPGCDAAGCCSPYCNLMEPNTCPGADMGQECVPWYPMGMAPPGQENIGGCAIPA